MRKPIKLSIIFLLILLVFIAFPTNSNAEDSLSINRWIVNSKIMENGDLQILEDITFNFDGRFNGVFRQILLKNTEGIENLQIGELVDGNEVKYSLVNEAENGDHNVFMIESQEDSKKSMNIKIFSPSFNEKKTFRLKYTVKNVATKYNDTGELYYKFLGHENSTSIDLFTVNIRLPKNKNNKVKIFAHGPLHGTINFAEDNLVRLEVKNVPEYTFVEARILFPTSFIANSTNTVNNDVYESIIEEEISYVKRIEEKQVRKEKTKKIFNYISLMVSGIMIFIMGFIYSKLRRNVNIYENGDYTPYPEDCTPAIAAYLTSSGPNTTTLMATIFDLARKGFISINNEDENKKDADFQLEKLRNPDNSLLSHETLLMEWLFDEIGNGISVTTEAIEDYGKKHSVKFSNSYQGWINEVKSNARDKGYYDNRGRKPGGLLITLSILTLFLAVIFIISGGYYGFFLIFVAILALIYGISYMYRKSDYGYMEYEKWQDFKKELRFRSNTLDIEDFSYPLDLGLIYGLALGVNTKFLKKFKTLTPGSNIPSHWLYWYYATGSRGQNSFENSLNSSFSSGSIGGGGGFSAGGGGGAGGGGAGGF